MYDQAGNRIHAERRDSLGTVTWSQDRAFDVQHHVVWESNPGLPSAGRRWSYDPTGFLSGMSDEEGRGALFSPDGLDRVQAVHRTGLNAQGNPLSLDDATYRFGANSDVLEAVTDGNGRATSYSYDDFGRVERVSSATLGRGGGVWYRYDARGNVVRRGDSFISVSYAYDGLDRLIEPPRIRWTPPMRGRMSRW